ncbi:MAG: ComEA family DNA-binding protein [Solobacterium sp.]|nr:ComEA family DNA-binding protein [Solobacterium sp.]
MKSMLIFFLLILTALYTDLKPLDLGSLQDQTIRVTVRGTDQGEEVIETDLYSTVSDVLQEVGTPENADLSTLNPQTILKDGDLITIPKIRTDEKPRISINTADAAELSQLPGIGPKTAEKIVAFREENGLFQTIEDLKRVSGIGTTKFEKLKDLICL